MDNRPVAVDYPTPGVRVEVFDETSPIRLRVRSAREMADWTPFVADVTRDESRRVATTIEYNNSLYAITKSESTPSGWQYDLVPWPSHELVRHTITLSRESWREARKQRRLESGLFVLDWTARGLGPVIALLPGSVQEHISEWLDYDAPGWTRINSIVVGVGSGVGWVVYVLSLLLTETWKEGVLSEPPGGWVGWVILLGLPYLVLDSLLRFLFVLTAEKPLGLLPLETAYQVLRLIFLGEQALPPELRRGTTLPQVATLDEAEKAGPDTTASQQPWPEDEREKALVPVEVEEQFLGVRVEVFEVTAPVCLRVRTKIEPLGWTIYTSDPGCRDSRRAPTTIEFRDALYAIKRRRKQPEGWQFDLIPWPEGEVVHSKVVLSPRFWQQNEEQKRIAARRRRRKPIVEASRFLIPFLPSRVQQRIGDNYEYNSDAWAIFNSGIIAWVAWAVTFYALYARVFDAIKTSPTPDTSPWLLRIALPIAIDSVVRFTAVVGTGRAIGFLPVEVGHQAFWAIRRRVGLREGNGSPAED